MFRPSFVPRLFFNESPGYEASLDQAIAMRQDDTGIVIMFLMKTWTPSIVI